MWQFTRNFAFVIMLNALQNALEVGTDFRKAPPSTTQPPRTTTTLGPLGPICRSLRRIGPDGEIRPGPLCWPYMLVMLGYRKKVCFEQFGQSIHFLVWFWNFISTMQISYQKILKLEIKWNVFGYFTNGCKILNSINVLALCIYVVMICCCTCSG